jgi:hypothetical protein
VLGLVFEAKIVGKPSIPLTLILSHQGRGKKGKWEKVRMRVRKPKIRHAMACRYIN